MNWEEFVEATDETAFYPDAGRKTPIEFSYVALGLVGEYGEYAAAPFHTEKIKEIGDCFWYLARAFKMLDGFELRTPQALSRLPYSYVMLVANTTKKTMRDGGVTEELADKLREQYAEIHSWLRLCVDDTACEFDNAELLYDEVIAKLRSRKERGMLSGGGDNR